MIFSTVLFVLVLSFFDIMLEHYFQLFCIGQVGPDDDRSKGSLDCVKQLTRIAVDMQRKVM